MPFKHHWNRMDSRGLGGWSGGFAGFPRLLALSALALLTSSGLAAPTLFINAKILAGDGVEFAKGMLAVEEGKIVYVGEGPFSHGPEAEVVDLGGKVLIPGLVDTHSHIGRLSGADSGSPIQPEVRVVDSINVRDASFRKARAGGITTVNVMHGSGQLISGQTLYLKLRKGETVEDLSITNREGQLAWGIKMANGTNSRREPPFPGSRAKAAALVRAKLLAAKEYMEKTERAGGDSEKLPTRDLGLEALVEALQGKRVVHHHTHRHDDILTVLRLKQEFGLKVVLHHVSDGWKVADQIAASDTPCSIIILDSPGGKQEALDIRWETGAALVEKGVSTAYHTDDYITDSRLFLRSAALGVRAGLSRAKALDSLTLAGARMLDLDDRIGSLEQGKDADFVVLSGDPFSVYTQVEQTWIEGKKVFDRSNESDRLMAVGGLGAGEPNACELCCTGPSNHKD